MKKIIFIFLLMFIFGCDQIPYYKNSELKEETAEVIAMNYIPSRSDTSISPGMDSDGDLVFSLSSHHYPEEWIVTLRCSEHNKTFSFRSKEIFERVKVGDNLTLKYVDEIRYNKKTWRDKYSKQVHSQILNEELVDCHTKQIIFKDNSALNRN